MATTRQRIITYIDGFNLYFGLRDSGFRRYYWLDLDKLATNLLKPGQVMVEVKYFTARLSSPLDKQRRQATFLEALATLPRLKIFEGHFLEKTVSCRACGVSWKSHEEKMTDVQIATELLADAFQDRFDSAMIISADSDLVPPVRAIRSLFPHKKVIAAFPPNRHSHHQKMAVHGHFTIGRANLARSQFPDPVVKADGHVLRRPATWT